MLITTYRQNPTAIRAVRAIVDFEGKHDELLCIQVNGVDTGVRVRLDRTGDGVLLVAGEKTFRHPVGDSND